MSLFWGPFFLAPKGESTPFVISGSEPVLSRSSGSRGARPSPRRGARLRFSGRVLVLLQHQGEQAPGPVGRHQDGRRQGADGEISLRGARGFFSLGSVSQHVLRVEGGSFRLLEIEGAE